MFIGATTKLQGDPNPDDPDSVPQYPAYQSPLRYRDAEVFSSTDAREWNPTDFSWRRVGFTVNGIWFTVWVWEGTRASVADITVAEDAIASVRVN
jgi:hypothetical protein